MSKLGLSLKISVPKSKTIPKPSIKIEAKDKRGYVILEDEEYKVYTSVPNLQPIAHKIRLTYVESFNKICDINVQ